MPAGMISKKMPSAICKLRGPMRSSDSDAIACTRTWMRGATRFASARRSVGTKKTLRMPKHGWFASASSMTLARPPAVGESEPSILSEPIRCAHQFVSIAELERRVSRIRNDTEVCLGPRLVKRPRSLHRTHDVIATLHYDGRDVPNTIDVTQQLIFAFEKAAVHEIVAFDASHCDREILLAPL